MKLHSFPKPKNIQIPKLSSRTATVSLQLSDFFGCLQSWENVYYIRHARPSVGKVVHIATLSCCALTSKKFHPQYEAQ